MIGVSFAAALPTTSRVPTVSHSRAENVMRDKWTLLIAGGCLGSVVGVIGASISDPEVGFPAWVDLTGVVVGFGLGVLTTGLVALLRHAMWSSRRKHQRKDVHEEELRPCV